MGCRIVSGCGAVGTHPKFVELELHWMVGVTSEFKGPRRGVGESAPELGVGWELEWLVEGSTELGESCGWREKESRVWKLRSQAPP